MGRTDSRLRDKSIHLGNYCPGSDFGFCDYHCCKMDYIKAGKFKMAINIDLWLIFVFLILNTVGNLASDVSFENLIFAPITLVLAFCALRLAVEK